MIDKEQIKSTFNRVEESLNLRFEKKGSLFIAKEDLEDLKKSISSGQFQNILALETKINPVIITQILLKNPWLINDKLLKNREFANYLKKKLKINNYIYLLKDIIEDNIYSTNTFKKFIEKIYYSLIELVECKKIVKDATLNDNIILICFERIMIDSKESGSLKIREIDEFFGNNLEIYEIVKNSPYLNNIMSTIDDKEDVARWILDNKSKGKMDQIWAVAFASLKKDAFNVSVNYIKNHMDFENDTTKWLIRNVFPKLFISAFKEQDTDSLGRYSENIINLYKSRDSYRIKILFLHMLEPKNFKIKELAWELLDEFETIGINDKFNKQVGTIRNWSEISEGYDSYENLYENFFAYNTNLSLKKTLDYFSKQFNNTKYTIIEELYINNKDDENVIKVISYHIALEMNKKSSKLMDILSPLPFNYVETIIEYISEHNINSETTITFLHENNRDDIVTKFLNEGR